MRSAMFMLLLLGCSTSSSQQQEIEEIKRRLTVIERRLGEGATAAPDPRGPGKPGGRHEEGPAGGPKGAVSIEGDALTVMLVRDGKRFQVPARLPAGEYEVQAIFAEGQPPTQAGTANVSPDEPVDLVCEAAKLTCVPRGGSRSIVP